MCGIAGFVNFNKNIENDIKIITDMTDTLKKRGPDEEGYFYSNNVLLGHRRLTVVDPNGGKQPMIKEYNGKKYIIVYNGELYNTEDLRKTLKDSGFIFSSYSDTEVLLTAYIFWKESCINYINGIFSFAIYDESRNKIFIARDHLGVKPLFFTKRGNALIFGSEIKTILASGMIDAEVDREGLLQLFSLGPAKVPGKCVYRNISEVPPAHFLVFDKYGIRLKEYWKPKCKVHNETAAETIIHTRELLLDAVKRQLTADVPVCTFLSGGLDSSAISAIAATEFKKSGKVLNTYSVDYTDNDLYFKPNKFEPTSDKYWAKVMADYIGSNHHNIENKTDILAYSLRDAVLANDLPGMADIDSSLYLFCKEVRRDNVVALSGECADEIFGGYPWYTRPDILSINTFPWSESLEMRKMILGKNIKNLEIEDYCRSQYENTLKMVPHIDGESKLEYKMRELFYLNIKWFMLTLLNRKDRMSMSNSLEVRVPFADYRIVEYAFNIPPEIKLYNGREKGLLREALRGILPDPIVERKKSPYPKVHNPNYTEIVRNFVLEILNDKSSPVLEIMDENFLRQLVDNTEKFMDKPWYGQLMRGPQLLAYIYQVNEWLKLYNVNIYI